MSNLLARPAFAMDRLYRADAASHFRGERKKVAWHSRAQGLTLNLNGSASGSGRHRGTYTSPPIQADFPFQEIVPSWNLRINEQTQGYRIYLRMGIGTRKWSPWFYFGSGGICHQIPTTKNTRSAKGWGAVNIDYLSLEKEASHFQYRVELENTGPLPASWNNQIALQRFFVSYSNISENEQLYKTHITPARKPHRLRSVQTRVPYRSQLAVPVKHLRNQICCPTCVAMVLEKHGIDKPTLQVADESYDPENKIYGAWPRASQTAANNGLEAWVQRFRTHEDVRQILAVGQPVMASIRVKNGELPSSSYNKSKGHLILLCGFRANGAYIVNDPFAADQRERKSSTPRRRWRKSGSTKVESALSSANQVIKKDKLLRISFRQFGGYHFLLLAMILTLLSVASRTASAREQSPVPDYYQVTTTAAYRPVSVPGTQRRVAQNDAEDKARRLIYEYVGSLPLSGRRTINDAMSRDARLKAKILEIIRNAELVDWNVIPKWSSVTVCMRVDVNLIRSVLACFGYESSRHIPCAVR